MALTLEFLENIGLTEAQIEAILAYQAQDAPEEGAEDWEARYGDLMQDFEAYREEIERQAQERRLREAYRALLMRMNVDPRRIDVILRATRFDGMALDEDGRLVDAEQLAQAIRRDWGDFIITRRTRGADVSLPPFGGPARRTKEEILAIPDTAERQRAISENHTLFGF